MAIKTQRATLSNGGADILLIDERPTLAAMRRTRSPFVF